MRNVIMIMVDSSFYEWIETLALDEHFRLCTTLSDRAYDGRYDLELVMRFLLLRKRAKSRLNVGDLGNFLDEESERLAANKSIDRDSEKSIFGTTFRMLYENYGDDIFRRYDRYKERHLGGFLISAFEVFAIGLGWHVKDSNTFVDKDILSEVIKEDLVRSRFLEQRRLRDFCFAEDSRSDPLRKKAP